MAGYAVSGRGDLDALFMARVNAARAAVGFQIAGSDIANRYEAIGAGTPIAATGFRSGGTDLASLFRNISESLQTFNIVNATASAVAAFFGQAGYQLGADGRITMTTGANDMVDVGSWLTPVSGMSAYSARGTQLSGSTISGVGSWINLAGDAYFGIGTSLTSNVTGAILLEIRRDSNSAIVDSAEIQFSARAT
jgi:hypothetical protein